MNSLHRDGDVRGPTRLSVVGARLTWMALGPMALLVTSVKIVQSGTGWCTPLDAFFFVVVGLMIAGRWYELHSGEGSDGFGNPNSLADLPQYLRTILPLALAAWTVANLMGNHVLSASN